MMVKLERAALITAPLIAALFLVGTFSLAAVPLSTRDPTRRELDRSMVVLLVTAAMFVAVFASLCWLITRGVKLYYEVKNTSDDNGDSNADPEEVKIEGNKPAGLQISDDSDDLTEIVLGDPNESAHDAVSIPTKVQAEGKERHVRKKLTKANSKRLILVLAKELDTLEDHKPDDFADDPDEIVIVKEDTAAE